MAEDESEAPWPPGTSESKSDEASQVNDLGSMMKTLRLGKLSDFIIKCGADEYKVHKTIISARSSFFERACFGRFREASRAMIELKEDDPLAVEAMVEYLYFDSYLHMELEPNGLFEWTSADLRMVPLHAHVYVLADKYDISGLCEVAKVNLEKVMRCHIHWITTSQFREAIEIVYKQTIETASIRDSVVDIIVHNGKSLDDEEFRDFILSVPLLSAKMIRAFAAMPMANVAVFTARCEGCEKTLTSAETLELVTGLKVSPRSLETRKRLAWQVVRHRWSLVSVTAPVAQAPTFVGACRSDAGDEFYEGDEFYGNGEI